MRTPVEPSAPARQQPDELRHPALVPGSRMADPRLLAALVSLRAGSAADPQGVAVRAPTTYRLDQRPRRRLELLAVGLAALGLAVAGISATLAVGSSEGVLGNLLLLVPAVLLFTAAVTLVRATRRLRLTVSDEGVTCHGFMSVITTSWPNVSAIGHVGRGIFEGSGLVLAREGNVRAPRLLVRSGLAGQAGFVPLAPFAAPLAGSALEADMRQRCPRLWASAYQRAPGVHLEEPERRRAVDGGPSLGGCPPERGFRRQVGLPFAAHRRSRRRRRR